jgi:hypothetical protein
MTERAFQDAVRQAALYRKWLYYHTYDSRRSPAGFVDCVLVRGARLLAVELKSATGRLTPAQQQWLEALSQVQQVETYVWRPTDLDAALDLLR